MSFPGVLGAAEWLADGLAARVPEDWHQGRTAYGGFSSALALVAAQRVGEDALAGGLPPLRSAQVSFVGPLAGELRVSARVLRAGRNAVWMAAEVASEGAGPGLVAAFVFMGAVVSGGASGGGSVLDFNDCPTPGGLIAPEEAACAIPAQAPAFLKAHMEARFALPRGSGTRPELCRWVRVKDRDGLDPMVGLLLAADALPPGVLPLLHPGVRVSSMGWQANVLTPSPATRDGWWLLRSSADYAQSGCSSQVMRIWNADAEPVMAGMQSIALFG